MINPLTGKLSPDLYEVIIYRGKDPITSITLKSTSPEEAVAQASKQLTPKVRIINEYPI
jgi:hypothetical protein